MDYTVVWHEALERLWFALLALAWIFMMIFAAYRMKGKRIKAYVRVLVFVGITVAYFGIVLMLAGINFWNN